mmetsp:Transcript_74727/g.226406  ORF Transcript_74727/g.226406 Transcript_74727/m.226406 type:complete len:333 (-) Transcript_74727:682-1680(-)
MPSGVVRKPGWDAETPVRSVCADAEAADDADLGVMTSSSLSSAKPSQHWLWQVEGAMVGASGAAASGGAVRRGIRTTVSLSRMAKIVVRRLVRGAAGRGVGTVRLGVTGVPGCEVRGDMGASGGGDGPSGCSGITLSAARHSAATGSLTGTTALAASAIASAVVRCCSAAFAMASATASAASARARKAPFSRCRLRSSCSPVLASASKTKSKRRTFSPRLMGKSQAPAEPNTTSLLLSRPDSAGPSGCLPLTSSSSPMGPSSLHAVALLGRGCARLLAMLARLPCWSPGAVLSKLPRRLPQAGSFLSSDGSAAAGGSQSGRAKGSVSANAWW